MREKCLGPRRVEETGNLDALVAAKFRPQSGSSRDQGQALSSCRLDHKFPVALIDLDDRAIANSSGQYLVCERVLKIFLDGSF
jgi:hypothetical protein